MNFIRRFSDITPKPGVFDSQFLYHGETAAFLRSLVPPGAGAYPMHKHPVDQIYFILEGEMSIQIHGEHFTVGPNTLVLLPAGTVHHNKNQTSNDELHLEIFAPLTPPNVLIAELTDPVDGPAPENCIRHVTDDGFIRPRPADPGFQVNWLLRRETGSANCAVSVHRTAPGSSGPPLHVHEFDQYYFILEGTMTVEVAGKTLEANKHEVVLLPAGVPHTQANKSGAPESHLTIVAPEPTVDTKFWDTPVDFVLKEKELIG